MATKVGISRKRPSQSLGDSVRADLAKNLKEKNLQFRYKAVENIMAPLIHQVSQELTEQPCKLFSILAL